MEEVPRGDPDGGILPVPSPPLLAGPYLRASPHPPSPAGSDLESFWTERSWPGVLRPPVLPASPTQLSPADERRAGREGSSAYLGRAAGRAPAQRLGPPPAPGGARGGWSDSAQRAGAGPGRGTGAQGLRLPETRELVLAPPLRGSAPFSGRGGAGARITVTSPPFRG